MNFSKSLLYICTTVFAIQAHSHILFINVNENQSEKKTIEAWAKKNGEKVYTIPKSNVYPSPVPLNNETFVTEFMEILKDLKDQTGVIDKVIVSGHSDGEYYSGAKDRPSKPNMLEVRGIAHLFKQSDRSKEGYIGKYDVSGGVNSEDDINILRQKFAPVSLMLMGCYSLKEQEMSDIWLSSTDTMQLLIGTEKIWPLGESKDAFDRIMMGLNYSQKIINQSLNTDSAEVNPVDEIKNSFDKLFRPLNAVDHDLILIQKPYSIPNVYLKLTTDKKNKTQFSAFPLVYKF